MTKIEAKFENMARLAEYRDYLRTHPKLTYLFIELTDQCNLNCLHCGSSCLQAKRHHINTDQLLRALKEVAQDYDPKSVMICLTGGEPMLHPAFSEIVRETVRLGFPWGMTTNGTLIDEEWAQRLKGLNLGSITISMDGLKEKHEWLRGVKGSFQKTVDAIRALNSVELPVQVTTVVHRQNFSELEAMYQLMCELKVFSWRIINMEPIGRALQHKDLLLKRDEMLRLLGFIREKRFL